MTIYNDKASEYINQVFVQQDAAQRQAMEETPRRGLPAINIKPEEGRFLQMLVRASGAKKVVEIGTLGGYSGIWIARGLAPGGRLITLEKEPYHAQVAREHFAAAGVEGLIDLRLGDAHQSLKDMVAEGPFDFVFVDAEKPGYNRYLDWAIENVRSGGIIAVHNAFRKGSVFGQAADDDYSELMRAFNRRVAEDERLLSTVYPAGDGMLISVKL